MAKIQFNIRLDPTLRKVLADISKKYRTSETSLIEAYLEWLRNGNSPIGYLKEKDDA